MPEHGETPGFGADLIADTAVFDALVGQDIATAQIDVKAGATLTSNAINDALAQAAAEFGGAGEAAPVIPGDPYTVKGMNKFTLYIEVEDGKIVSVSAPNHNETPGLGADLLTEDALAALVGQDLATAQVDVKSGVTLTSNAINDALRQAAAAAAPADEVKAAPAAEGNATVYEVQVMGINSKHPFTLDISVDEAGVIVGATCIEHSETEGKGATMLTDEALSVLVGQSISDAKVDIKSGVTVTSNAINNALAIIAAHVD